MIIDSDGLATSSAPLALTHVVRARVRAPEAAPPYGSWATWWAPGRLRVALALLMVVLLAVSGGAWLRWGPAWPWRATAAPAAATGSAARRSGRTTGARSLAATASPTPRPTNGAAASAGGRPTTTAPPTRTIGKLPASRSRGPATAGDAHWSMVLGELDRHRQAAFATDDPAPLAAVYVPGTLLQQDVAALHQAVGPGCRLIGLRTRYRDVHLSSSADRRVVLATRASLDSASLQCPGSPARRLPAHRTVAMTVVLVPNGSAYLISGIDVSV